MTQNLVNTLNNLEQVLTAKSDIKKLSESVNSGMDKTKDFTKVFESTIDKKRLSMHDMKDTNAVVNEKAKNDSLFSEEFKSVLQEITEEANVETSLDLTLAKDINEIISQLKEAVENVTEIIEEDPVEENLEYIDESIEGIPLVENSNNVDDELIMDSENTDDELSLEFQSEAINISCFNQLSSTIDKSSFNILAQNAEEEQQSLNLISDNKDVELASDAILEGVVDMVENLSDEVVSIKPSKDIESNDSEFVLEQELVEALEVESISIENDMQQESSLMQNQAPEEYAVKAIINKEAEVFDIKIDSSQGLQNQQATPIKTVEINPARIIEQITKQLEGLQNNSKINIVLNPESLGKVNIQLFASKEGLTAQFTVTTQEARDLLMKGLDGLKESLISQGIGVDNITVKVADSQKSEYNQDWTEQEGSRGGNKKQEQSNKEEKEKGLFEKTLAQTTEEENGNV